MYVISYPELTTTALNINALTLQTVETFTTLAVCYLVIVWTMSALDPGRRAPSRPARGRAMSFLPDWAEPVLRYMFEVGLRGTLQIAALSLTGSLLIGVTLGTLLTIKFMPSRALIRLYIEVWRGLPILVTLFLVFFLAPRGRPEARVRRAHLGLDRADALGERAGRRGDARCGAVDPEGAARSCSALGFGWIGRHAFVILPQALRRLLPPLVSLLVNIIQNSTIAQVIGAPELLESAERQVERLAAPPPIGIGEVEAIPIYATVMVIFFCISFPLTRLSAYLEKRLT